MNRSNYYTYISEKLSSFANQININGKINFLDLNVHAETFFAFMLNKIFDYELQNLNSEKQNVEAIDLIDRNKEIIVQVSSTCTKKKLETSLKKESLKQYIGYTFKFVSISKDAKNLRKISSLSVPSGILFDPKKDIIDNGSILNEIAHMQIDKQKEIYDFVKKELGSNDMDFNKVDTNLATIINILAREDLSVCIQPPEINSFEIEKKIKFNNLDLMKSIINENVIYYNKLDEKYTEFDKMGKNKSLSVFKSINSRYIQYLVEGKRGELLFLSIVNSLIDFVKESRNYIEIEYEVLEMCINILVVDAFIRCKIFENPEGYNHVITR